MKKLLLTTLAVLLSLSLFGRHRTELSLADRTDREILYDLREAGYTVLPEVRVIAYRNPQDTIKYKQQRFSSRFETKGGRGYLLPKGANDSTWTPRQKKEWDDLYYQPSKDGKIVKHQKRQNIDAVVDTLIKENPDIQVNNYYNDDPFFYSNQIGMFYHGGFNYWHYNPFFYDPWYDFDFGWGWNPYYGYNYPYYNGFYFGYNSYWGWNFGWNWGWNWYHPYYWHNDYWHGGYNNFYGHNNFYGNHQQPQYGRRERPSNLTNNQIDNRKIQPQGNRNIGLQQRTNSQDKPMYNQTRRNYQPSYNNPRMSERPLYNNSRIQNNNINLHDSRSNVNTQRRIETNTQSRTQIGTDRRTYQQVNKNQNYNVPSRSYSPPRTMERSSQSQGFGRTFNFNSGGSSSRSSSSGSNSGGSSSGGRSSGSSGRR